MGSAEAAELTKLAENDRPRRQLAYANELARYADRLGLDVGARHRRRQQPALQPHPQPRRRGRGRDRIPVYPHFLLAGDPDAQLPRDRATSTTRCPPTPSTCSRRALGGSLQGKAIAILGVAYRGGVKETAFSGAAALHDELRARGARALASDPLYDDDELIVASATNRGRPATPRRGRDRPGRPRRLPRARSRRRRRRTGRS